MASKTITIRLKKSIVGCSPKQRIQVIGLGLRKTNSVKTLENTPAVRGMIKKIIHMVEIVNQ